MKHFSCLVRAQLCVCPHFYLVYKQLTNMSQTEAKKPIELFFSLSLPSALLFPQKKKKTPLLSNCRFTNYAITSVIDI